MCTNGAFRAHCLQAKRKAEEFEVCSVCVRRFANLYLIISPIFFDGIFAVLLIVFFVFAAEHISYFV